MIDEDTYRDLKLAAKAADYDVEFRDGEPFGRWRRAQGYGVMYWDPLGNHHDAFQLAILLQMELSLKGQTFSCHAGYKLFLEGVEGDPAATARSLIVRAAAHIGAGL